MRCFGLYLLCFGSAASAEFTQADSSNLNSIRLLASEIQAALGSQNEGSHSIRVSVHNLEGSAQDIYGDTHAIRSDVHDMRSATLAIQSTLNNINGYLTGSDLRGLRAALDNILVAISNRPTTQVVVTNGGFGFNVADLNPWWATNSAFVTSKDYYSDAYPDESPDYVHSFSFPQFMSLWGAKLNQPGNYTDAQTRANWSRWWGFDSLSRWWTDRQGRRPNYTWFDWITDAFRSNWVLHANLAASVSSNATEDANSIISTLGSFEEGLGVALSNLLAVASASTNVDQNPWWYTNSDFSVRWDYYQDAFPTSPNQDDFSGMPQSFPQAFSEFASWLNSGLYFSQGDNPQDLAAWDQFGASKYASPLHDGQAYTAFDWLADFLKSNMAFQASLFGSASLSNALEEAGSTEDFSTTNVPLPPFALPEVEIDQNAVDTLQNAQSTLENKVQSIMPGTSGNAEIVLIPAFSVGGINVSEYRASLDSPIVATCRIVCSFIYGVSLFAYLLGLAKDDWVYYSTIGKHWRDK